MREYTIQLEGDNCIRANMNNQMINDLHSSLRYGGGLFHIEDVMGFTYHINTDKVVFIVDEKDK